MSRDGTNRPDGHRRKWDKGEYEKKAKARSREERGLDAEEEDNRYSKKSSNRKDPLNHHKDRNARDKDAEEEDEDWDALDEDWDGYKGTLVNNPITRVSRFKSNSLAYITRLWFVIASKYLQLILIYRVLKA
jgi:hypothetical protein